MTALICRTFRTVVQTSSTGRVGGWRQERAAIHLFNAGAASIAAERPQAASYLFEEAKVSTDIG